MFPRSQLHCKGNRMFRLGGGGGGGALLSSSGVQIQSHYWIGGRKDIANILKHFVSFFLSVLFIWFPAFSFA